jgi:2-deoxy-D-gluconate 3-dehydrogenase
VTPVTDLFSLHGRTALVTGARSGIGQAIAVGLAEAGADLVVLGHANNMDETVGKIKEKNKRVEVVVADLSEIETVTRVSREILDSHQIDILINNAGVIRRGPAEGISDAEWRGVLGVNLDAVFALCREVGRPMLERGYGKVVNVASLLAFQGGIEVASYAASKHAVAGLTRALATEWGPRGVQVNAIAPGYVETDVTRALRDDPARRQAITDRIPAGRWGRPADLVGAAVFLASGASDYVNGHLLAVDGGWLAR